MIDESKEGVIKSVSYESEVSMVPLIRKRPLIGDQVYNIEKLSFHLRGVHVGLELECSTEVRLHTPPRFNKNLSLILPFLESRWYLRWHRKELSGNHFEQR